VKSILLEGLLVAILGVVLALAANAISPQGLSLQRNYFPPMTNVPARVIVSGQEPGVGSTNSVRDRLLAKGLQYATALEAKAAFDDLGYKEGRIIFIDARADEPYFAGHIPGAWQLNYYHPEKNLPEVLPATFAAEKILIYCNGGECEDSEFTTLLLKQAGVPGERLFIFGGGILEWSAQRWPIETGARHSGSITNAP
jgi:3-mercaptopyruvate sulfurtransferase SseA